MAEAKDLAVVVVLAAAADAFNLVSRGFALMQGLALFLFSFPLLAVETVNNGENIVRPVARFDGRVKFQAQVDAIEGKSVILTARTDQLYHFSNGWKVFLRADVPYEWFYCPKKSCCENSNCFGDSLLQLFFITPTCHDRTYAAGIKLIFPTAGNNSFIGDAKYQILPSLAFGYDLNNLSPGSYAGLIVRHGFDVGGFRKAPTINQTFIEPFFNWSLPNGWFLNSSPESIYNWQTDRWFIPLDLMIGKMITPKLVASVEYEYGLVNDYPQYKQQIEFRLGIFF